MISKALTVTLLLLAIVAVSTAVTLFHLDNARLRRQIAAARVVTGRTSHQREENRRLEELVTQTREERPAADRAIDGELSRLRAEVAAAEQRAHQVHAEAVAQRHRDAEALATNRDPRQGLVRLEYFSDVGQATPEGAFQSFVWAATQGKDERLAALIHIDEAAREKADALVAALPEADRAKFPTAERVAALCMADAMTMQTAAQIVAVTMPDVDHALVEVRGLSDRTQKFPFERSGTGWQLSVNVRMVTKLTAWVQSKVGSSH
jgi:hypothetical protein